ncbi:hypothetical protein BKA61DRAFT_630108 [Leptodontidium sp. MPI-SDFR-AT-0119]|nr:hypothetical protein BKA61DRAFT_630108 [Leptodontidium sp. MPI-SDFR-AT-0119]
MTVRRIGLLVAFILLRGRLCLILLLEAVFDPTATYIVENYVEGEYEIWIFGLSRGAYTLRCVGGMINNCGIVKHGDLNNDEMNLLSQSWQLIGDEVPFGPKREPPIRFMSFFDTVGSLKIPTFTGGVGLDWPEFYDQDISSVVERVYQAVSLHDRLYIFHPTLWGSFRTLFCEIGISEKVVEPNHVPADLTLKWILESIKKYDPESLIVNGVDGKISNIRNNMVSENRKTGDGDQLLFALGDRHIPDDTAAVYDYMVVDPAISNTLSIQRLARIDNLTGNRLEDENKMYLSTTLQAWILRR